MLEVNLPGYSTSKPHARIAMRTNEVNRIEN